MSAPVYNPIGPIRQQVREATAAWLRAGDLPAVDQVHATYPRRLDFAYRTPSPHRCQVVVTVRSEREYRVALGGAVSGKKRIDYEMGLEVYQHSVHPDTGVGMANFETVIDAIKDQVRSNHTFGDDTGLIFQAGEGRSGLQIDYAPPRQVGSEAIELWGSINFELSVWITA